MAIPDALPVLAPNRRTQRQGTRSSEKRPRVKVRGPHEGERKESHAVRGLLGGEKRLAKALHREQDEPGSCRVHTKGSGRVFKITRDSMHGDEDAVQRCRL